jgi:His-Xaa-Ser system protein HxsD
MPPVDQTNTPKAGTLQVEVDLSIYSLDVLMKALHSLTGKCHVRVERKGPERAICWLMPKGTGGESLQEIERKFHDELLDHALRARLAQETEPIRRLILAQAFSQVRLLGDGQK